MRTCTDYLIPSLVVTWACIACAGPVTKPEAVADVEQAYVEVANGLKTINGLTATNGMIGINGLDDANGLTLINDNEVLNGLATARGQVVPCCADSQPCDAPARKTAQNDPASCAPDGLLSAKTGMMSTSAGVVTASYVVRCALPAGDAITVRDFKGQLVRLNGELGLAPQWKTGVCDTTCQEWISACLMALTNATGEHVTIELSSRAPSIGSSHSFPLQEAAFYGNVFPRRSPSAFQCLSFEQLPHMIDRWGAVLRVCEGYETLLGTGKCPYKLSGFCMPLPAGSTYRPWSDDGDNTETQLLGLRVGTCRHDTTDFGNATECSSLTVNDYKWHNVVTTYVSDGLLGWYYWMHWTTSLTRFYTVPTLRISNQTAWGTPPNQLENGCMQIAFDPLFPEGYHGGRDLSYQCSYNSGPFEACTSNQQKCGFTDGAQWLLINAYDTDGNWVTQGGPFPPLFDGGDWDVVPPVVTITSPASGSRYNSPVPITYTLSEILSNVQCQFDTGAFGACNSTRSLSSGSHTLTIKAVDTNGNLTTTSSAFWVN